MTDLLEKEVLSGGDDVRQYLSEIRRYPMLTAPEERELARRCAAGDADAIRAMVSANLRLVVSIAREYAGRGVPLLDLIQEGCIGLLSAAKKYDYTRQCRFATYAALWIRQSITRYLENHSSIIRVPAHTAELMHRVTAAQTALRQSTGTEPDVEAVADCCGLTPEKVEKLLALQPETCSLDAPASEDTSVGGLLEDVQSPQPQQRLVRQALNETMERLLSMLTPRQQQVLRLRFGMEDGTSYSLEKVGEMLNISKERARQLQHQAMDRMLKLGASLGLEDFLE